MRADAFLLALYIVAVLFVLYQFMSLWPLAIALLLLLLIMLIQKLHLDRKLEVELAGRRNVLSRIEERMDAFARGIEAVRVELNRSMFVIGSRLTELESSKSEMRSSNEMLATKLIEIENKLTSIKKTLGAAFGSLDDRIHLMEEQED
ncbi:MAG: hypothetical protein HYY37_02105 [Candidatus Aenigmarchaeota archaeon]|nr:hypothetical protein [Candidatus Aenigmarchaeota archaeon]